MRWKLETARKSDGERVIEVVGGPHPYIWIGDEREGCFGVIGGYSEDERAELRALRDNLTRVLRRGPEGDTP